MATQTTEPRPSQRLALSSEEQRLLAEGTLTDRGIQAHPRAFYRAMRHGDPIHYDEKLGSWLVTRHEDISAVQSDPLTFSVHHGYHEQQARGMHEEFRAYLKEHGGGYFPDAIMSDPPYHTRIRKLMENAFTAHRVKELEPRITEVVRALIGEVIARDGTRCDAVKDIAIPLTIRIIVEQLGLDQGMEDRISRWSVAVTAQIGRMQSREQMIENAKEICDLQHYLIAKMKQREAVPGEDMISDLVHAEVTNADGTREKLTFEEAVSLVRATLIAGNDTTATAIGNLFYVLTTKPGMAELLESVIDDDRRLNRFVEEHLRNEPPVRALSRMAVKETVVNGTTIPEGAHMLLVYASGNDDETVFPEPRKFDIDRPNLGRHVAFGGGPHRCIGLALARMEVKVAAREIVRQMKNIRLAIPEGEITYTPTVATHTIESLPITFERREA
ncbi:cytochrome P450 [Novosphingobium album (ex Liu et al. 2023)]|uniref:Cytochrome P450 n=1 Tax=Novosphingobium album (ex Liu et al. 2023) TaxID=3031130 RepID=A0ABT5WTR4_9SPHN|nr:cytochrome P450 [Novosphingobium album (ex Liu et al. 2023)]MDE8653280.1 cytochrome P450 [Novosphingobium album (ex Liu et al. 2023)]